MKQKIYALKNVNAQYSASGGAFPVIIQTLQDSVIRVGDKPLVVYGAAFNRDFSVNHIRAVSDDEISRLSGSKYVQSNLGTTFKQVSDDLQSNRCVLFSGTPCQVNSLLMYLIRTCINTEKLYTCDIICHGTPRPKVWNDYVKWIENKEQSKLEEFSFRWQKSRWKVYPVRAKFQNRTELINTHEIRLYTKLFLRNLIMRECCYSCKFANMKRVGDITIGDFWGIEKVMPNFPHRYGVSQVIVNSEKGNKIIDKIKAESIRGLTLDECISKDFLLYQHNLITKTVKPEQVNQLWRDYNEYGIEYILKKYADYSGIGKIKHIITKIIAK